MTEETKTEAQSLQDARHVLAEQAADALKTVSSAAAEAIKIKNAEDKNDHDILLTFRAEAQTELRGIRDDIKKLSDGTTDKISDLEKQKNDIKDSYLVLYKKGVDCSIDDHEQRIKKTENSISWVWGGLAILGFLFVIIAALVSYIFSSNTANMKDQMQDIKLLLQNHITNNNQ